jgi:16S rRNA processing protein RimM
LSKLTPSVKPAKPLNSPNVELGRFAGAYGVHASVRIETWASPTDSLLRQYKVWFAADGSSWTVEQIRIHGAGSSACLVAQIQEIPHREAAQALKGQGIYLPRSCFPEAVLKPDEYFQADLVGLRVQNRQGLILGIVNGLDCHGAADFLVIQEDGKNTHLIPFVSQYVDQVDLLAGCILVDWDPEWSA